MSPEIFSLKYDYVYCWCIPTGKKKDHSTLNASQASVHQGLIPIITTISSCCCLFLDQLVERSIGNMRCVVCLKSLKGETPSECPMGIKSSVTSEHAYKMVFFEPNPTVTYFMTCSVFCAELIEISVNVPCVIGHHFPPMTSFTSKT